MNYTFNIARAMAANKSTYIYDYLFEYLPTTADRDATDSEWDNRQLVWSFKNDPNRRCRFSYEEALYRIVPAYEDLLRDNFGDSCSELTLVCIPASNSNKNERRWKEFSDQVCSDLDMYNGYYYIKVTGSAVARHLGGSGSPSLLFDKDYFKGKKVVICDDVKTTGRSIQTMRERLQSMGATVVGAITIAKTVRD